MTNKKKGGGNKKPAAPLKIQVNAGKGRFKWITQKQLEAEIKKGRAPQVTSRSVDKVSTTLKKQIQKNEKAQKPQGGKRPFKSDDRTKASREQSKGQTAKAGASRANKTSSKSRRDSRQDDYYTEQPKQPTKRIKAGKIQYSKEAMRELRKSVRSQGGHFLKKEDYLKILAERDKGKKDLEDILIKLADKNPNVKIISEATDETLHFQVGDFIDRIEEGGDELKSGAKLEIIGFDGLKTIFTSKAKVLKYLNELNSKINDVITDVEKAAKLPKGKKLSIYITIPETKQSDSNGQITKVIWDYSDYKTQGIDRGTFDYYLNYE